MTALQKYDRLEAIGAWRASATATPVEVVVSFGDATLKIAATDDTPLAHWALGALRVVHRGENGTLYSADPDDAEVILIDDDEMIAAIETVRAALIRPVRTRRMGIVWRLLIAGFVVAAGLGVAQTPDLLRAQIASQTSDIRAQALAEKLAKLLGRRCDSVAGEQALRMLAIQLDPALVWQGHDAIIAIDGAGLQVLTLPDGTLVLGRAALEQSPSSEALAASLRAALDQRDQQPPMLQLMHGLNLRAVMGFLLRGWPDDAALLAALHETAPPGQATLTAPPLDDQSWVALQGICDL